MNPRDDISVGLAIVTLAATCCLNVRDGTDKVPCADCIDDVVIAISAIDQSHRDVPREPKAQILEDEGNLLPAVVAALQYLAGGSKDDLFPGTFQLYRKHNGVVKFRYMGPNA